MNLTSIHNEKVKFWSSLKIKKYRDKEKLFLIEGDHLVNKALKENLVVDLISLDDNYDFDNKFIVTKDIMKKISNQMSISNVAATVKYFKKSDINGNVIILDNVQDPGNLGTIIRSASAFSFDTIILGNGTVDLYNDKVIRASEGMIFDHVFIKGDLKEIFEGLKKLNYHIIGTDVKLGRDIKQELSKNVAIVIGNEGNGMNPVLKCDSYVKIPINKNCESLNAGVAASILMYEVYNGK